MKRRHGFFLIFTVMIMLFGSSASAARFPNSVAKSFSVQGPAAQPWLKALGLDPIIPQHLSLALHHMEVHARNIRIGDAAKTTAISNQISWDPKTQTLSLSGDWLDQTTGSPRHLPRFTFGSGFIAADLSDAGAWGELLKAWGFPRSKDEASKFGDILDKRVSGASFPKLTVTVYRAQSYDKNPKGVLGYQVYIGIDEK